MEIIEAYNVLNDDRLIWERQSWETDAEFEMFQIYRDLPAPRRSMAEVSRVYTGAKTDVSPSWVRRVGAKNRWAERVESYTMHIDDQLRDALESERVRTRIAYLDIGREIREKAAEAVHALETIMYDDEGKKRSSLTPKQLIDLLRASMEFERFALLMDTPSSSVSVQIMNISDSQLLADAREVLEAHRIVAEQG